MAKRIYGDHERLFIEDTHADDDFNESLSPRMVRLYYRHVPVHVMNKINEEARGRRNRSDELYAFKKLFGWSVTGWDDGFFFVTEKGDSKPTRFLYSKENLSHLVERLDLVDVTEYLTRMRILRDNEDQLGVEKVAEDNGEHPFAQPPSSTITESSGTTQES